MAYESPRLPIDFKIERVIKQRIADGSYPLDTRIPGEYDLSKEFGVHRLTVRHALILLVQEGFLKRFRKRGTFVSKKVEEIEELGFKVFFDDLLYHVGKFKAKEVQMSTQKPLKMIAELYQLDQNKDRAKVIKEFVF